MVKRRGRLGCLVVIPHSHARGPRAKVVRQVKTPWGLGSNRVLAPHVSFDYLLDLTR